MADGEATELVKLLWVPGAGEGFVIWGYLSHPESRSHLPGTQFSQETPVTLTTFDMSPAEDAHPI